ncbi:hypothetical protein EVG20_g7991 [Dentipellis fragilis]|uniref:Uncharacterized protein n=1 Tax=Dentipellis fragilis TaxID=205917 RepID=A0A4Y9Y966_9AGAM|nr:hypothetical protein EVG20_g7991 [Dentipellis fragilis]
MRKDFAGTNMHEALKSPSIVRYIVEILYPSEISRVEQYLECDETEYPLSLSPLLNCLDDTKLPLPGPKKLRNPSRLESPNDLKWGRFNYYANRVGSLLVDHDDRIPNTVFLMLETTVLAEYYDISGGIIRLTIFPGEVGTTLDDDWRTSIVTLMSSLSSRSPSLEAVDITLDKEDMLLAGDLRDEAS